MNHVAASTDNSPCTRLWLVGSFLGGQGVCRLPLLDFHGTFHKLYLRASVLSTLLWYLSLTRKQAPLSSLYLAQCLAHSRGSRNDYCVKNRLSLCYPRQFAECLVHKQANILTSICPHHAPDTTLSTLYLSHLNLTTIIKAGIIMPSLQIKKGPDSLTTCGHRFLVSVI